MNIFKLNFRRGSALVIVVVIFGMFIVIMGATTAYVNRQFNRTVHDESREAALYAAEAGLNYVVEALTQTWYKPTELLEKGNLGMPINADPTAESSVLLFFGKEPTLEESQGLRVVANGMAFGGECRAIEAVVHRASNQNNVFTVAYKDILGKCTVPSCWVGLQGARDYAEGPEGTINYSWSSSGTTSCSSEDDPNVSGTSGTSSVPGTSTEIAVTCQCSGFGAVTDSLSCPVGEGTCGQGGTSTLPPAPVPGATPTPVPSPGEEFSCFLDNMDAEPQFYEDDDEVTISVQSVHKQPPEDEYLEVGSVQFDINGPDLFAYVGNATKVETITLNEWVISTWEYTTANLPYGPFSPQNLYATGTALDGTTTCEASTAVQPRVYCSSGAPGCGSDDYGSDDYE